ncbi:MAG: 2-C-methyl-D-erythritol 4-phosphate cytidylyltransferase [Planctomycetota bacterium]|nr:2-C-methyl-D-erythritol 4-phosphate cytidylyltransferase [Planctomycetota bacterium]MDA1140392.1 2-C-methyl-D-erythritol 4-phosphate cytidylyltransferase [Planctomycetota bacterium]
MNPDPSLNANLGAVLTAAGESRRLQLGQRKPYLDLDGRPILLRTLAAFSPLDFVREIVIVVNKKDRDEVLHNWGDELAAMKVTQVVCGGTERQDSVRSGVEALSETIEWVAIHDGVRPFVRADGIQATFRAALATGAAILATPMKETVKRLSPDSGYPIPETDRQAQGIIAATVSRSDLWCAHTPQIFPRAKYLEVSRKAGEEGWQVTDDAQLFEMAGLPVALVEGTYDNIKITTEADYRLAQSMSSWWFQASHA